MTISLEKLTEKAIKILQDNLGNHRLPPEVRVDIALKILSLPTTQSQAIPEISSIGDRPPETSDVISQTLPIPELYNLSESWQKWLVENKLRGVSDQSLVDILKGQGIEESVAHQMIFTVPQEVTFRFLEPQWRSLQQYQFIADLYRTQELLNPIQISRHSQCSETEFYHQYYQPHSPVILTDLGDDTSWQKLEILINQFGDRPITPKIFPTLHPQNTHKTEQSNLQIQTLQEYQKIPEPNVYIEMDLLEWGQELIDAIALNYPQIGHYLDLQNILEEQIYLWFQSTFSPFPLQAKADNTLVLQLAGESQWHLCSPWYSEFLYGDEHWVSYIDVTQPDFQRYPLLKQATFQTVSLHAGEALFIPSMWWQQCRVLQNSVQMIGFNFKH